MEKVKLSKEIVNLLQVIKNDGFSDYALIGMLYVADKNYDPIFQLSGHMGQGSDKMHPDDLVKALVNGYEVEETPEDKVRECYENIAVSHGSYTREDVTGIIRNIFIDLNIKIEGIN